MISGTNLQDVQLAREQAKINKRREDNEVRRVRYLQAKVRLIGQDVQALDAQVAERQRMKQQERDMNKYDRLQAIEIERLLAQSIEEERQMKEFQMKQIKSSWEEAKDLKKILSSQPQLKDFDNEHCGPAAALKFSGEDSSRATRAKQQKEQVRNWIQEQISEKAALKHVQHEEDMSFAEMMKAIDEIRTATEREEAELRRYIVESVKQSNQELARQQAAAKGRQNEKKYGENGEALLTSLPAFDEDQLLALDASGHIIRRDMFKGFTPEQQRRILQDNLSLLEEKSHQREEDKMRETEWMRQQLMALRAMEQAEFEEKQLRDNLKDAHLSYLQEQMEEQKRGREAWEREKYGHIGGGFFDGFGKTCR